MPPTTRDMPRSPSPSVGTEISVSPERKRKADEPTELSSELDNASSAGRQSTNFNPLLPYLNSNRAPSVTSGYPSTAGSVYQSPSLRRRKKPRLEFKERIEILISAIFRLSDDQDQNWFSDPKNFIDLPYPSTAYKIPDGFDVVRDSDGSRRFSYMSRRIFQEIFDAANFLFEVSDSSAEDRGTLNLYGPLGAGKSYLLAALACLLIRQGKDVIYIPSCKVLIKGQPTAILKELLSFSFPDLQEDVNTIGNLEGLIEFLESFITGSIICIVDGLDELEPKLGDPQERSHYKSMANSIINVLYTNHVLLCSAPPGSTSFVTRRLNGEVQKAGENIKTSFVIGGLTPEEMECWWYHYRDDIPLSMSDSDKEEFEYITGKLPLLLEVLLKFRGQMFEDIKQRLMDDMMFQDVRADVISFTEMKLESLSSNNERLSLNLFYSLMKACIQESAFHNRRRHDLLDHRFFYFVNNVGYSSSGIARDAATEVLLHHRPDFLLGTDSVTVVSRIEDNPTLKGYLSEMICLNYISAFGLMSVNTNLGAMPISRFSEIPEWWSLKNVSGKKKIYRQLHIPERCNYEAIDGVIALMDENNHSFVLFPIQITIAAIHKDSETMFFQTWWFKYLDTLTDYLDILEKRDGQRYSIAVHFVWIHWKDEIVQNEDRSVPVPTRRQVSRYKLYKIPLVKVVPTFDDHQLLKGESGLTST